MCCDSQLLLYPPRRWVRPGARILPAVPRPDFSKGEALGHQQVPGIGKAISILLLGVLSPWALPLSPAYALHVFCAQFRKLCFWQPVFLAEQEDRVRPCLASGAYPPIQPKLPPSCWLRLLELQTLPLPKQPLTSLYAPQKYHMLSRMPWWQCSGLLWCG